MTKYIALLRGINVGGKRIIKMDSLRSLFVTIGFSNIKTYIQSGNIIFDYKDSNKEVLQNTISKAISKTFEIEVPVIILKIEELEAIIHHNPFKNIEDKNQLHFVFLSNNILIPMINSIEKTKYLPDEFEITDNAIYLKCQNGYGQTKLTNSYFDKKFDVVTTTRNWKTTIELLNLSKKI